MRRNVPRSDFALCGGRDTCCQSAAAKSSRTLPGSSARVHFRMVGESTTHQHQESKWLRWRGGQIRYGEMVKCLAFARRCIISRWWDRRGWNSRVFNRLHFLEGTVLLLIAPIYGRWRHHVFSCDIMCLMHGKGWSCTVSRHNGTSMWPPHCACPVSCVKNTFIALRWSAGDSFSACAASVFSTEGLGLYCFRIMLHRCLWRWNLENNLLMFPGKISVSDFSERKCSRSSSKIFPHRSKSPKIGGISGIHSPSWPAVGILCWGGEIFCSTDTVIQHIPLRSEHW